MKGKRVLSLILALALCIGLLPTLASAASAPTQQYTYGDLTYIIEDGEITIIKCNKDATNVDIPAEIDGFPVTKIGNARRVGQYVSGSSPFYNCKNLLSVTLPDSMTTIGSLAFYGCSSLTSITLPNSVTTIGESAFQRCTSLTSITIPNGVTTIAENTFYNCRSLASITLPNSVTTIGDRAFSGCSNLTSVTLPNSVTSIGAYAFSGCRSLTSIVLSNSVTTIGDRAFSSCSNLASVTLPNSVTSIGAYAFSGCRSLTSIVLPNSVSTIGDYAFLGCWLSDITLPDSVTSIGKQAFYACHLNNVTISKNIKEIGEQAFTANHNLTRFVVDKENLYFSADDEGVLFNHDKTTLVCVPGKYSGVYSVPDSVNEIGSYAVSRCNRLTCVEISKNVSEIGEQAFTWSYNLTHFVVDEENLYFSTDDAGVLFNYNKTTLVCMPEAYSGAYVIPKSVTEIGAYACFDCFRLERVTIPDSVTSIGDGAFIRCESLTSITIPGSVTSIGEGAFDRCTNLTSVTIQDGVTSIGEDAFYNCNSLTSITIPGSIISIGEGAFTQCDSLIEVTIRDGVTSIGDLAFSSCISLTSITIPGSVTSIGQTAFYGCTNLASVTMQDGVTSIGDWAFENCTSLTSITIPGSVSGMGYSVFLDSALESIYFVGDAPVMDEDCFRAITATAYYPKGNETWTEDVRQDYGGTITWVEWEVTEIPDETPDETPGEDLEDLLPFPTQTFVSLLAALTKQEHRFADVSSTDYFAEAVNWAVEKGITAGTSTGTFSPNKTCTRAEMVTFLWRAAGCPEPTGTAATLTDVDTNAYYYKAVLWAIEQGITTGTGAATFSPEACCTRAQIVTFLYRYYQE